MKEKKKASDWWIATTHWLTSFFVPTFIAGIIGWFAAMLLVISLGLTEETAEQAVPYVVTINVVLTILFIGWLGPMYGARYLNKKYIIADNNVIARNATIIVVILGGGFRIVQILSNGLTYEHIGFLVAIILFYFSSKKYIKRTEMPSAPATPPQAAPPQSTPPQPMQ